MTEIELLEPSIADVLAAIEAAPDLSASKKTHWSCSLRQVSIGVGRPPESIPGRWSGVNIPLQKLHHARMGCNPKTLANHNANARAALMWFAGVNNLPKRGTILSPSWTSLNAKIPEKFRRKRLSGLIRYASAKGIEPEEVNEEVLDDYMRYRAETTALAANSAARRLIARAWNACAGAIADCFDALPQPQKELCHARDREDVQAGPRYVVDHYSCQQDEIKTAPGGAPRRNLAQPLYRALSH
jgi:hypothetical protein